MEFFNSPANTFTPEEKIQTYTEVYNQLNIKQITLNRINSFFSLAMQELNRLTVNPASLFELKNYCNLLIQREF